MAQMMRQLSPEQAKQAVEQAFFEWGLPLRARFDNGFPFANTADRYVPTALALWLVSLGIEVVFNRPHSPQQNGSVECTQRISSRWANLKACAKATELQQALDQVAQDHIFVLRQRSKGDRTRIEQYPGLLDNPRRYDPNNIDPGRVRQYLAQFNWTRKVYANGRVTIFGTTWPIGTKYKNQTLSIRLDPQSDAWLVSLSNGTTLTKLYGIDLSKNAIANLTVFQRT
jgi:hypothetical protein